MDLTSENIQKIECMDCGESVPLLLWHEHQGECQGKNPVVASTNVCHGNPPVGVSTSVTPGVPPVGASTSVTPGVPPVGASTNICCGNPIAGVSTSVQVRPQFTNIQV